MKQITVRECKAKLSEYLKDLPFEIVNGKTKLVIARVSPVGITVKLGVPEKEVVIQEIPKMGECQVPDCDKVAIGVGKFPRHTSYTDWNDPLNMCAVHLKKYGAI